MSGVWMSLDRVMSTFRIPMRGYEVTVEDDSALVSVFRIPMRGYEHEGYDALTALSPGSESP